MFYIKNMQDISLTRYPTILRLSLMENTYSESTRSDDFFIHLVVPLERIPYLCICSKYSEWHIPCFMT
jgi:hypothetical protein